MIKGKVPRGMSLLSGCLLFIIGVVLCFTFVGMIIGIPCILIALFMGGRTQPVWKCANCGAVVERAVGFFEFG